MRVHGGRPVVVVELTRSRGLEGCTGYLVAVVVMGWVDDVRALVERTCAEQGLPVQVTDRATVEQVVVLLGRTDGGGAPKRGSASAPPAPAGSEAPEGLDALDGNCSDASGAGHDLYVVNQCLHDGALPVEVEFGPLLAQRSAVTDVGVDVPRAG